MFFAMCVSVLASALPAQDGLRAEYFRDRALAQPFLTRIDPQVAFDWWRSGPQVGLPIDQFSARWTGHLVATTSGLHQVGLRADDGVRLWLDDQLLIDRWSDSSIRSNTVTVDLRAGEPRRLRLEFYERRGLARILLQWAPPGQPWDLIPPSALRPVDILPPATPTGLTLRLDTIGPVLSWNPAYDNVAVSGYDVLREGVVVASTGLTTWTDRNLTLGSTATYAVRARDYVGGISSPTLPAPVTRTDRLGRGTGPWATYFRGTDLTDVLHSRQETLVGADWAGKAPAPGVPATTWSARWVGQVLSPVTGPVTFHLRSDDGSRLRVADRLVIDAWRAQSATTRTATVPLVAGVAYPVEITYYQAGGRSSCQVSWSAPGLPLQVIPTSAWHPAPGGPPPRVDQVQATTLLPAARQVNITATVTHPLGLPVALILQDAAGTRHLAGQVLGRPGQPVPWSFTARVPATGSQTWHLEATDSAGAVTVSPVAVVVPVVPTTALVAATRR